jgi:hypothetical protein
MFYKAESSLSRNSFISCDTIELMLIAALMSIDVSNSLGRHSQSREAALSRESKLMQGLNTLAIIVLTRIKCGLNIKIIDCSELTPISLITVRDIISKMLFTVEGELSVASFFSLF